MRVGLLERCGFTNHAIERFAARAGLRTTNRQIIEPLIRELLLREGTVVSERPRWARSRNRADLYLHLVARAAPGLHQDTPAAKYRRLTTRTDQRARQCSYRAANPAPVGCSPRSATSTIREPPTRSASTSRRFSTRSGRAVAYGRSRSRLLPWQREHVET